MQISLPAIARAPEEVTEETSPLIQGTLPLDFFSCFGFFDEELLRRTEEKREQREKERLEDYNRKNFKVKRRRLLEKFRPIAPLSAQDYFSVSLDSRELSAETKEKIKKWLDENK